MKNPLALFAALLLMAAPISAQTNPLTGEFRETSVSPGATAPAYRFVEGLSDGVYDFMRRHVIGALLPDRLARSLKAAPKENSALLFDQNLHENEARYLARVRAAYPLAGDGRRAASEAQIQAWRSWAASEQISVAVDSLTDTLLERYQLELFGHSSGAYAKDRRNWEPGFLTMSGILGGTFLYLNGMHAVGHVGGLRIGLDLASGLKLQEALQGGKDAHRLAGLELGLKGRRLALATEWGSRGGRLKNERVGLVYRLRY